MTNVAESLATQVCRQYGISPQGLVWIEHYPESSLASGESWSRVTFDFNWSRAEFVRPEWRYITRKDVEALRADTIPMRLES